MARRSIVSVTLDNLAALPQNCRSCGYWESGETASIQGKFPNGAAEKALWYEAVLSGWGPCGKMVIEEDEVLAYCQYAPATYLPQIKNYSIGPISADAVFLACLFVPAVYRGRGLGKLLVTAAQKEQIKRGYRALETYTRRAPARNPSGWTEFYLANGWQVISDSGSLAHLRLDLRSLVTWQVNLDAVLQNLVIPVPAKA